MSGPKAVSDERNIAMTVLHKLIALGLVEAPKMTPEVTRALAEEVAKELRFSGLKLVRK